MDHLSSCYFCGAALDEPLGAYTINATDEGPSVTLCVSCRHKLDRLLDGNGIGQVMSVHREPEASVPEEGHQSISDLTAEEDAGSAENPSAEETVDDGTVGAAAEQGPDMQQSPEADDPAVGETDPTELLSESEVSGPNKSESPADQPESDSDNTEAETTGEWTSDSSEWGEPDERGDSLDDTQTTKQHLEPMTTSPEKLPDGEEVKEIPGLDVSDDKSAPDGLETEIQDEMQPNVPDEFGESPSQSDDMTTPVADDSATTSTEDDTAQSETPESDTDTFEDDKRADGDSIEEAVEPDDEPAPFENDQPIASDDDSLTAEGGSGETQPAGEESIDPSIRQADEIASGNAEIDDVLDGEIEIPDELAAELDETAETDSSLSPEPETNGQAAVDSDDPFDLDTEADPERESVEPEGVSDENGGFDFDSEPGSTTDDDEDLQSEMEPNIPDQFRNDSSGQSGRQEGDTVDEPIESGAVSEEDEAEPSEEDIAFSDEFDDKPATPEPSESDEQSDIGNGDESAVSAEPDRDESDRAAAGESSDERRRSISALEYNKVMRLLQNREFPVDRMELMAVAASTYDLSEADCAEVLDIAIDRGLLAQDGNRLIKPD